jgi:hypothetical protein
MPQTPFPIAIAVSISQSTQSRHRSTVSNQADKHRAAPNLFADHSSYVRGVCAVDCRSDTSVVKVYVQVGLAAINLKAQTCGESSA